MEIKKIQTANAPSPAGHYSQAVSYGNLVFVSGQLSIDPQTGTQKSGSIEEQTEQVLKNISEILIAANSSLDRLLKVTVYLSDIELWAAFNQAYARVLGNHRPARAAVPTKELRPGFLIEIEAIAAINE